MQASCFKDETCISVKVIICGDAEGITGFFRYWIEQNNHAICFVDVTIKNICIGIELKKC